MGYDNTTTQIDDWMNNNFSDLAGDWLNDCAPEEDKQRFKEFCQNTLNQELNDTEEE